MKRRAFIGIAAVGAAGVVLPPTMRGETSVAATLAHPRLPTILQDERVVGELGRRYRALVPNEDDERVITRAILDDLRAIGVESTEDASVPKVWPARIDRRVQADFDQGRTVTLQGWILAVTEARQCALFSLLQA